MSLDLYKNIYLIGIGGIGMSALARYFNARGCLVYGYDKLESDLCKELENEGINIHYSDLVNDMPEQIRNTESNNILVIYTPAIPIENKIFSYFIEKRFNVYKRSEVLGMISRKLFTIAVAGTHGKTTTSTILAHILQNSGKEITAFLGGISRNYNTNLLLADKANILIIEADEYDRSFLELEPDIAIITSVDADHLDVYNNKDDLHQAFIQFASQIKQNGLLLVEDSIDIDLPKPEGGVKSTYSANNKADYFARNVKINDGRMLFDMIVLDSMKGIPYERKQVNLDLRLPGIHNVSNSLAASAVSIYLGLSYNNIAQGLSTFKGIVRRFDKHIETKELVYIDDYAHHPNEVSATITAAKQLYPSREITVVFQPHLYTRTQQFASEFALSLSKADNLVLLDIYPAREEPIIDVNSEMLLDLCNSPKQEVCSKQELLSVLRCKDIDVLLTLGAGDIGDLVEPIKHMLN
ncbi:MAG: UDP-N-acetylmuramate--L-alanine ligase [Flavobacteriales bacterium]|nr:UDP-N-acetylmuramate--L-alanine ligase [Flavobacteriales bacterium]|tara:strand:+ start:30427 stop:31827 length:1401 start_codon:yes stop_codon:yes gene_type:complete